MGRNWKTRFARERQNGNGCQAHAKCFDKAMLTRNPFIEGLIDDYLMFRNHNKIHISRALDDSALRIEIDRHNRE